jgi:hypothetical protein
MPMQNVTSHFVLLRKTNVIYVIEKIKQRARERERMRVSGSDTRTDVEYVQELEKNQQQKFLLSGSVYRKYFLSSLIAIYRKSFGDVEK